MKIIAFITTIFFTITAFSMGSMDSIAMIKAVKIELERIKLIESIKNGDTIDFAGKQIENLNKALYTAITNNRTDLITDIIDAGAEVTSPEATLALIFVTVDNDKNAMGLLLDAGVKHKKLAASLYFAAEHLSNEVLSKLLSSYIFKKRCLTQALRILLSKKNTISRNTCLSLLGNVGAIIPCPRVEQLQKRLR